MLDFKKWNCLILLYGAIKLIIIFYYYYYYYYYYCYYYDDDDDGDDDDDVNDSIAGLLSSLQTRRQAIPHNLLDTYQGVICNLLCLRGSRSVRRKATSLYDTDLAIDNFHNMPQ